MAKRPPSLFKFQPFGPHTGINLVMLVENSCLFLPKKSALNDPTDCDPEIIVDENNASIMEDLKKISDLDEGFFSSRADHILDIFLRSHKAKPSGIKLAAIELISNFIKSEIGMPGVFSMSAHWNISQMWSYYADSHKGFCIELSGIDNTDDEIIIEKVNYTDKRPQISLDDVLEIRAGGARSKRNITSIYCEKSNSWREELEYRFVARDGLGKVILSLPNGDFIRFSEIKIKSVYFGMRCDKRNINFVLDLFKSRSKDSIPEFYSVNQSSGGYELDISLVNFDNSHPPPPPVPMKNERNTELSSDDLIAELARLMAEEASNSK